MKNFFNYYQDELLFLRQKGGAFAKKHPEVAEHIDIKDARSMDPHTERIIESVAFMSAQLHQRIDDNSQHIAFHILNALYPNLVNPLPPCSVVSLNSPLDKKSREILDIPRHTKLSSPSKSGSSCSFRTIYNLKFYPISIKNINVMKNTLHENNANSWCIKIDVSTNSVPIDFMNIDKLLFHINSNIIEDALTIYEAIFANPNADIFLQVNDRSIKLPKNSIRQCGFEDKDTICPINKYSSNIFQLFQEIIHFKQKFMFFEISNIDKIIKQHQITNISDISIIIDISFTRERLLQIVKKDSIMLNCVPITNLFHFTSDPFRFSGKQNRYLLLADQLRDQEIEIHSILDIHLVDNNTSENSVVQPYFSLPTSSNQNDEIHELFWLHTREPAEARNLPGNDIYISFIDINLNPYDVYDKVVYAKLLCTNRFESREIPIFAKMNIEALETGDISAKLLYKMTDTIEFSNNSTNLWSLVSQLSSTNISMSKEENLLPPIKQLIKLFSANFNVKAEELISGISKIITSKIVRRFGDDAWRGFVPGIEFNIYCKDESKSHFAFFLCSVINQYLSSCVSINSFIQLNLISEKTNMMIASWSPTSGRKELV